MCTDVRLEDVLVRSTSIIQRPMLGQSGNASESGGIRVEIDQVADVLRSAERSFRRQRASRSTCSTTTATKTADKYRQVRAGLERGRPEVADVSYVLE